VAVKFRTVLIASAALAVGALLATAAAQPYGPGSGIMGPGMMTGPGMIGSWMMGRRGFGGMCNPGFAEWRTDRLADLVRLNDAQRGKFDEFKTASVKSAEIMRSACQAEIPETIVARTEAMEKRMDTMLQAVRTMRPALEAFWDVFWDPMVCEYTIQKPMAGQAYVWGYLAARTKIGGSIGAGGIPK